MIVEVCNSQLDFVTEVDCIVIQPLIHVLGQGLARYNRDSGVYILHRDIELAEDLYE